MEGCGTAGIEKKLDDFTSDINIGFTLDVIISDLYILKNNKNHRLKEECIRETYQKVLDICVKNKVNYKVNYDVLEYLTEMRDGKVFPKQVIEYVINELSELNSRYLSKSQQDIQEKLV